MGFFASLTILIDKFRLIGSYTTLHERNSTSPHQTSSQCLSGSHRRCHLGGGAALTAEDQSRNRGSALGSGVVGAAR